MGLSAGAPVWVFVHVTAQCRDAYFGKSHIFAHPAAVLDIAHPQAQLRIAGLLNLAVVSPHALNANSPAASRRSRKNQRQNRPSRLDDETRMASSFIPDQPKTDSARLTKYFVTSVLNVLDSEAAHTCRNRWTPPAGIVLDPMFTRCPGVTFLAERHAKPRFWVPRLHLSN